MTNELYYGDNLSILRDHIANESVDLVYLDPPFNSSATYNVLFRAPTGEQSQAQVDAFADTWHWNAAAEDAYWQVLNGSNARAAKALNAMRGILGDNDMMAYLAMIAVRLIELHRVLKSTGSLYLHCDSTASHYLKLLLDAIFATGNFRNEIVWKRKAGRGETNRRAVRFGVNHDTILFYAKSDAHKFNRQHRTNDPNYIASKFVHVDKQGRRYRLDNLTSPSYRANLIYDYKGYKPPKKGWAVSRETMERMDAEGRIYFPADKTKRLQRWRYLDELDGETVDTLWDDIPPINSQAQERLSYPTQKPVALLERIVATSSREGDVVLDPFCGCGTTVHAAQKLNRRWIGIDITHLAISLVERRLRDAFKTTVSFQTFGVPKDLAGARALAENPADKSRKEFEKWAITLVPDAHPVRSGKKGADGGMDGLVYFRLGARETAKGIVSVKGGRNVSVAMIRELKAVVEREMAQMGLFLTLTEPTGPMNKEAVAAGFWEPSEGKKFPKIQILTIEELLAGRRPQVPMIDPTVYKRAQRVDRSKDKQEGFGF